VDVSQVNIDPKLLEIIVCPSCRSDVALSEAGLTCIRCGSCYAFDGGIALLLPSTFDIEHLREEESLTKMMRAKELLPEMRFNLDQWDRSKVDFWQMVGAHLGHGTNRLINIGCGFDPGFRSLTDAGHMFVNFDMVLDMLRDLKVRCPAGHYVNGDLKALPFRPSAFDYVISIDVLHHECEHLKDMLTSWRDLLKPGGTLFLEDPNAWGLFQMAKSIFMPRPVYRYLRSTYHQLRRSAHRPADYEFPTDVWKVKSLLRDLGFEQIRVYPHTAYPTISRRSYEIYNWLSRSKYVRTYHNYHYMLSAVRSRRP
jgi:SAM-dependent methyltransferase